MKMIFARSLNGVIGVDNKLPWHLPEDLQQFKEYTTGQKVILGGKTHESMGFKPLPNRESYVLSRTLKEEDHPGINILRDISEIREHKDAIIIGGSSLFTYAMEHDLVDEIRMTIVLRNIEMLPEHNYTTLNLNPSPVRWHTVEKDYSNPDFTVFLMRRINR